jgi:predicted transcriptional regulator
MVSEKTLPKRSDAQRKEALWENRGSLEIMSSIVAACENGALKTHIMYRSNLNSGQMRNYMAFLLKSGFIEKRRDEHASRYIYQTTEQGRRFLAQYNKLLEILSLQGES